MTLKRVAVGLFVAGGVSVVMTVAGATPSTTTSTVPASTTSTVSTVPASTASTGRAVTTSTAGTPQPSTAVGPSQHLTRPVPVQPRYTG